MSYTVLIVDDSKLARMAVIKALNASYPDWVRVEAASAAEALQAMVKTEPHVALVDFNMPVQDGLHLAAELLRMRPRMPLAIISANHQQEVINRTHALGATFLAKPIAERDLTEFLRCAACEFEAPLRE